MKSEQLVDLPYEYKSLEPYISEKVLEWHHKTHHQGYVNGLNNAESELEKQRQDGDFSSTGSILNSFTHNYCGNVLHEIFWENMSASAKKRPEGELKKEIEKEFGSYQNWKKEFKEAAKSASGWALLVYIPRNDTLHNVTVDNHDEGAVWGAHPILALDVWEHSYYHDYGPDRASFIENFFEILDWSDVENRYSEISTTFE